MTGNRATTDASYCSIENGIVAFYETLCEIPNAPNHQIDSVFVMLCLPDVDVNKVLVELFDPIVQTVKVLLNHK